MAKFPVKRAFAYCNKGYYLSNAVPPGRTSTSGEWCYPCPNNTYADKGNRDRQCKQCSICLWSEGLQEERKCSAINDATCRCRAGDEQEPSRECEQRRPDSARYVSKAAPIIAEKGHDARSGNSSATHIVVERQGNASPYQNLDVQLTITASVIVLIVVVTLSLVQRHGRKYRRRQHSTALEPVDFEENVLGETKGYEIPCLQTFDASASVGSEPPTGKLLLTNSNCAVYQCSSDSSGAPQLEVSDSVLNDSSSKLHCA